MIPLPLQIFWLNHFHHFSFLSIWPVSYDWGFHIVVTYKIWPIYYDNHYVYQSNWPQHQQPYKLNTFASIHPNRYSAKQNKKQNVENFGLHLYWIRESQNRKKAAIYTFKKPFSIIAYVDTLNAIVIGMARLPKASPIVSSSSSSSFRRSWMKFE